MSEQAIIQRLEKAVRMEKAAPEILPFESELVAETVNSIDIQHKIIDQPVQSAHEKFQSTIYQLDLDRVKFSLTSYLRTRILKIQSFIHYIVNHDLGDLLSENELEFATKYFILKTNLFKKRFLSELPQEVNRLEEEQYQISHITAPNLESYVFVRVLTDLGRVFIQDGHSILMNKDDIHFLPYSAIKAYIETSNLELL